MAHPADKGQTKVESGTKYQLGFGYLSSTMILTYSAVNTGILVVNPRRGVLEYKGESMRYQRSTYSATVVLIYGLLYMVVGSARRLKLCLQSFIIDNFCSAGCFRLPHHIQHDSLVSRRIDTVVYSYSLISSLVRPRVICCLIVQSILACNDEIVSDL